MKTLLSKLFRRKQLRRIARYEALLDELLRAIAEPEITAETLAVNQGFSTREQSTVRINGGQWDQNVDQLARENKKLSEARKALGENGGEETDEQILALAERLSAEA